LVRRFPVLHFPLLPPQTRQQNAQACKDVQPVTDHRLRPWYGQTAAVRSVKAAAAQVVGDDDIGDGVEDKLDVVSVGGTRLVTVHLLRRALVLRFKLRLDIRRCLLVALLTCTTSSSSSSLTAHS